MAPAAAPVPNRRARLAAWFRPSHLLWAIPGPIFHKEVWTAGRKAGTYWIRTLFILGLLAIVSLVFIGQRIDDSGGSASQRLQRLQQVAPTITLTLIWFQFVALPLVALIVNGPSICDEKRAGTLGTLLTTPLHAWQIVLGKLAAFGVQALVLTLASLPLLMAIRLFGGVSASDLAAASWLTLSTTALAATLSVHHSVGAKRSPTAVIAALLTLVATQFIVPLAIAGAFLVAEWLKLGWRPTPNIFALLSPPVAMAMVSTSIASSGAFLPAGPSVWFAAGLWNWALVVLFFLAASLRLRRVMAREGAAGSAIPTKPAARTTARTAAPPSAQPTDPAASPAASPSTPAPRKARRAPSPHASRDVSDQPILWRELRQPTFRSNVQKWLFIIVIGLAALLIYGSLVIDIHRLAPGLGYTWTLDFDSLGEEGLNFPLSVIAFVISLLHGCMTTGQLIAGERESRTLDVLLATPLSAREIILGKFWGAMRRQWFAPSLFFAHLVVVSVLGPVRFVMILHTALLLLPAIAATVATGLWLSVCLGKSSRASALNFGLWALCWAIAPLVMALVLASFGFRGGLSKLMSVVACANPVAMSIVNAMGGIHARSSDRYELFDLGHLGPWEFTLVAIIFALGYGLVTLIFLRLAANTLAAKSGRAG